MRRQTATTTGTNTSNLVVFDQYISPFSVGIGTVVSGPATYTVQFTLDDVNASGYTAASGQWYSAFDTALVNATNSVISSTITPVTASRINQTAGTGTVTVTYIQAGIGVM